jgi:hypothetical protein
MKHMGSSDGDYRSSIKSPLSRYAIPGCNKRHSCNILSFPPHSAEQSRFPGDFMRRCHSAVRRRRANPRRGAASIRAAFPQGDAFKNNSRKNGVK